MVTAVDFQTGTFCLSESMASMGHSTNAVRRNSLMSRLSTTVNSTLVRRSPILICSVIMPLLLSQSFDTDTSAGFISIDILDNQSVGRKYFEIRFGWAPTSMRQTTRCVILCSMPIEMRTKNPYCHAAERVEF